MAKGDLIPGASADPEEREARSYDFGRMAQKMPDAVAAPGSAREVSDIIVRAARDGVRLAIRGGGHSQGGQALADTGLVIDMKRLDRVELLGEELVRAQGGALWGKVVDSLHGTRLLPAVLVDVAEVTVGGTLSAGGIGTTSHRHGMQVGQVEQLEVVTGTGEIVLCSRARNADLFDAVRSGQGQFGVITEAWIRLRKTMERARMYELGYRDADRLVDDLGRIWTRTGSTTCGSKPGPTHNSWSCMPASSMTAPSTTARRSKGWGTTRCRSSTTRTRSGARRCFRSSDSAG